MFFVFSFVFCSCKRNSYSSIRIAGRSEKENICKNGMLKRTRNNKAPHYTNWRKRSKRSKRGWSFWRKKNTYCRIIIVIIQNWIFYLVIDMFMTQKYVVYLLVTFFPTQLCVLALSHFIRILLIAFGWFILNDF